MKASFLIVGCVVISSIILSSCSPHGSKKDVAEKNRMEARAIVIQEAKALVSKHDANTSWEEPEILSEVFTIELQKKIASLNNAPCLVLTSVVDISVKGDVLELTANSWFSDVYYKFEASSAQADSIMKVGKRDNLGGVPVVLIAQLLDVQRPSMQLNAKAEGEDYAVIEASESEVFIIRGRCIDLLCYDLGKDLTREEIVAP